ncbi:uncharacterized protein LOC135282937 isoform X6 [Passer domesticus]|uniref:uncharacterized protein LOC135282937 isoform X6 n=1 Tax=Passer domesticus TaxID=48849 RepID=UPI0030FED6D7
MRERPSQLEQYLQNDCTNLNNDQAGEADSVYPLLPPAPKDKCCGSYKKPLPRADLVTVLCVLLFHQEKDSVSRLHCFLLLFYDTFKIQMQRAFLDVYLADGSNIRLYIQTSDTAERILQW